MPPRPRLPRISSAATPARMKVGRHSGSIFGARRGVFTGLELVVRPPGAALKREFVYDSAFFLNLTPGWSPLVNSTPARSIAGLAQRYRSASSNTSCANKPRATPKRSQVSRAGGGVSVIAPPNTNGQELHVGLGFASPSSASRPADLRS
jgi:hypothetical protein